MPYSDLAKEFLIFADAVCIFADATPERYGTTAKKLYEGTDKSEFSRSKSPGYQQHCPGFNKSNFLGSVIHPTLQNSIGMPLGGATRKFHNIGVNPRHCLKFEGLNIFVSM